MYTTTTRASRALRALSLLAITLGCAACADSASHRGGQGNGATALGGSGGSGAPGDIPGGALGNPDGVSGNVGGNGGGGTGGSSSGVVAADGPINIDACPGSFAAGQVALLKDPSAATVAPMRWLYPYDMTVFPRGLEAPLLQWDEAGTPTATAEAVYVHLKSSSFDYQGCLPPTKAGQLQIPQDMWDQAAVQSRGSSDPLSIDVTTLVAGKASKLPTRKLVFALATLKNAIYYNTYNSPLASAMGLGFGGVVMRITPKQAQPDVFLKASNPANCIGCHAVSADGSKLVAEEHAQPGLAQASGGIYDLSGGMVNPTRAVELLKAGFSGLSPDGSYYLTTARPGAGPTTDGQVKGTFGPQPSKLVATATGADVPTAIGAPADALMPMFSVDGKMIAFNQGGHGLSIMQFDKASTTFSALTSVYSDPMSFVAWPSFLPDVAGSGRRVVFALSLTDDYVTEDVTAIEFRSRPHRSDLQWIDLDSRKAAALSRAGGFEGGTNYMPYGDRDAHRDFMPTVSPVAAGGYFWIFFTSRRQYGNELVYNDSDAAPAAESKKIWVAAIDANAAPGTDPSHPAFFLPGQEHASGNVRAFAALSPCHEDGNTCESGIDCCSGHCLNGMCGLPPPEAPQCSELDDKCATTSDCCEGKGLSCIGGFCGFVVPD
ncbi:MAG TPA: hypothetical protein VHM19_02070 [Polyangiales bacterium]|jgi:hypothetical protein|nr:hypothetical protein [Polyangiales bacterium]